VNALGARVYCLSGQWTRAPQIVRANEHSGRCNAGLILRHARQVIHAKRGGKLFVGLSIRELSEARDTRDRASVWKQA
jgi:hypothetical protein